MNQDLPRLRGPLLNAVITLQECQMMVTEDGALHQRFLDMVDLGKYKFNYLFAIILIYL